MSPVQIVHIEDDTVDARIMRECLYSTLRPLVLSQFETLKAGLNHLKTNNADVILVDLSLPDGNGHDVLTKLRKEFNAHPIIVATGNIDQDQAEHFVELGADDYLFKEEVTPSLLWKSIVYAISKRKIQGELQKQTQDLLLASELERRANSSKTEFLANVSHELRTPLGIILGYSELLENSENLSSEGAQHLFRIRRNSHLLVELVNDLLDLSKIESGHLEPIWKEVDLVTELEDILSSFAVKANEKGLEFDFQFCSSLARTAVTDQLRFKQILNNVISNALKFTDKGGISVAISANIQEQTQVLTIDVQDTGPGISDAEQQRIFEPFQQGDHRTRQSFGGAGLGLALSNRLAKVLGGSLELVRSKLGEGSTFRLRLPCKKPETAWDVQLDPMSVLQTLLHPRNQRGVMAKWENKSVLLADDNPDNLFLIEYFLNKLGFIVDSVSDGAQAIEQALIGQYDLILMDMQMPVKSGYEAVSHLRFHGYTKPIIALTAYAMAFEKRRCLELGCNEHVGKPVTLQSLAAGIQKVLPTELTESLHSENADESKRTHQEKETNKGADNDFDEEWESDPDYLEVREFFLSNLDGYIRNIRNLALNVDRENLSMAAHTLKGTSASFGMKDIANVCALLESQARQNCDAETIAATIHCLNLVYRQIQKNEPKNCSEKPTETCL